MWERVRIGEGRGRCRMRSQRWGSKATADVFAAMGGEGDVGRVRSDGRRGRCRRHSHRAGSSPANRQPTAPSPPGGEARRTWGVSPMVDARPPNPRVERAAGLQSQRSKTSETRGKMRRSQVHCARHAFTSQLTLAVRRRNLEYGASAVFPCGVIPATNPQGRVPAFGRLPNYGSRVI